ncbi:MAG: lysylphosphatidylglycerol synthase transmembrane domain-containing protein [bacterium]|nr:MAG: hypothetical protein DIU52_00730 [bacterium]
MMHASPTTEPNGVDAAPEPSGGAGPARGSGRSAIPRRALIAAKLIVSCALIALILRGTHVGEVLNAIARADMRLVFLSLCLFFVGYGITVGRWRILLRTQRVEASLPALLRSYMVAIFFNNLLPSTIGGDAVRVYDSWRLGCGKAEAVVVIFMDRFMGLLSLVLFACAGLALLPELPVAAPLAQTAAFLGMGGIAVMLWLMFSPASRPASGPRRPSVAFPRIQHALNRVREAVASFRGKRGALGQALALSLLLQVNVVVSYYLLARSIGLSVPFLDYFLIIPAALLVLMAPVSINGIGLREGAFVFFLGLYGVGKAEAVAFAWVAYAVLLVQGLLGGIIYAFRR